MSTSLHSSTSHKEPLFLFRCRKHDVPGELQIATNQKPRSTALSRERSLLQRAALLLLVTSCWTARLACSCSTASGNCEYEGSPTSPPDSTLACGSRQLPQLRPLEHRYRLAASISVRIACITAAILADLATSREPMNLSCTAPPSQHVFSTGERPSPGA